MSRSNTAGKQPTTWDQYERGRRGDSPSSIGSLGSRVQWSDNLSPHRQHEDSRRSSNASPHDGENDRLNVLRRRRSSLNVKIQALRQIGGVNSIDNFARSIQRAAGYQEILPIRPSFRFAEDADDEPSYSKSDIESPQTVRGLLHQAFAGRNSSEHAVDDAVSPGEVSQQPTEDTSLLHSGTTRIHRIPPSWNDSIFSVGPSLVSGFGGSYGTYGTYGARLARPRQPSIMHAADIFRDDQVKDLPIGDTPEDPLLIKQVEEDGVTYNVVVGQSTLYQSILNNINTLIGIGLLALPLGLLYSGWVIGTIFFIYAALSTKYTAKLLAKALDKDVSLITYSDLAYVSFGPKAQVATSILFCLELVAACVALVILFADSLNALVPGYSLDLWKVFCGLLLIPLSFLPLRYLGFTSILGIICCIAIFLSITIGGLLRHDKPGSLLHPMTTYAFPLRWQTIPLSFGLLMSPWGAHSVFPAIYRDMRHPYKWTRAVDITYLFTFGLDFATMALGLLMFGDDVMDAVTSNILFMEGGYPAAIPLIIITSIAIIPLTKVPLNAAPIVSTLELVCGISARNTNLTGLVPQVARIVVRLFVICVFVGLAIVFPAFDRIMALLGSVACFSICIILPVGFHLALFKDELTKRDKLINWTLLVSSLLMAIVSTIFACLPQEILHGRKL